MAETLVEKEVCESCGSEVRNGSAFCYNCGESVAEDPPPPAILRPDPGLLNGGENIRGSKTVAFDPEPPPVTIPLTSLDADPVPPSAAAKTEKFPAAASRTRRSPRARVKKAAEVEWVEKSSSSSIGFIVTAIVFAVLTVFLVLAALSLR